MQHGQKIVLEGEADVIPGDNVLQKQHDSFERDENDLYIKEKINL